MDGRCRSREPALTSPRTGPDRTGAPAADLGPQWRPSSLPGGDPIPLTIIRVGVGLGFAAIGILLELGLDQVVGVAPWLVVAFAAGLGGAILGGLVGGVVAALVGVAGQVVAIPAWLPAVRSIEGTGWVLEGATAAVALAAGLVIRRLILDGRRSAPSRAPAGRAWPERTERGAMPQVPDRGRGLDGRTDAPGVGDRPPSPADDLAVVAAAIRDVGAVRTPIQVADALARHVSILADSPQVTVYLRAEDADTLNRLGGTSPPDPDAPAQLPVEAVERSAGRTMPPAVPSEGLLPITVQTIGRARLVGAVRLGTPGRPVGTRQPSPLLPVVLQLAADALERVRLDTARRSAAADAAGADRRLAILGGLALELVGGRTIDEVAATLLGFAVDDLAAGFAAVHVRDEATGDFHLVDARGYPAGLAAAERTIAAGASSPVTSAAAAHEPVEIAGEDGWRAAFPRASNVPAITGARAISAIPMEAGGTVLGVLTIGWRAAAERSAADRGMLAAAAAQGSQALERAILHAHDEDARRFQEAFIGVVSHELRTPITTILAGSRLLHRRLEHDPRSSELAEDIEIETDRLTRIVDDLLVLSRLERRHLTIGDDPVHLDHLLARIIRSETARWPSHTFDIPTSPNRHVVMGDETYVEQILRNLVSNAAKYSPAGSTIRVRVDDTPTGEVEVRVLDEGPGVVPGEVDELFTLFYRSRNTAAMAAGAGIGLFVSRQLVTEMGGRMWAQPRPEGGSEFGFSLGSYPIDEPDPEEDLAPATAADPAGSRR